MSEHPASRAEGFVEVSGARLFFEVEGDGPPLVLIHAGIADLRMWDELVLRLVGRFRVIRYDLRGFGRSSMAPGPYSPIEDLRALLDKLKVTRAHLAGVSYGGKVALEFALRYPLRVASLTLVAPGLSGFEWSAEMLDYGARGDALAAKGDLDGLMDLDLRTWLAGPRRRLDSIDPALVARVSPMVRGANARWAEQAGGTPQWLDPPAATRLRSVKAPTQVMVGDGDLADMVAIADLIEAQLPNARKIVFKGAAHLVPLERPAEFAAAVSAFALGEGGLPTVRGHP